MSQRLREWFGRKKRGFFEAMKSVIPRHDRPDWQHFSFYDYCRRFDQYYNEHTDIKAHVLSAAGLCVADGIYVKEAGDYPRAKEAAEKIEQFNKRAHMQKMIYETAIRMAKYGTCFWEKDLNSIHGLNVQLIPHQEYMAPHWSEVTGEVDEWHFLIHGVPKIKWQADQVCVFAWNVGENAPFGTSLLTGIDTELDIKGNILTNLEAYLEKQAFASNVLQIGDGNYMPNESQIQNIESKVKNREVGEDFVTSFPTNLQVMGAASIETRMIPDALKFTQERIEDAMLIPTISKLYNSTEASSKEMTKHSRAVLILPMQMIISQVVQEQVYQPYLEDLGYSVRVVPELAFEPPDKMLQDMMGEVNVADLVDRKIVSRRAAAEVFGFGEEYERDEMDKWDEVDLQMPMQQQQPEQGGESWQVTKLKSQPQKPVPKRKVKEAVSDEEVKRLIDNLEVIAVNLSKSHAKDEKTRQMEQKILTFLTKKFELT